MNNYDQGYQDMMTKIAGPASWLAKKFTKWGPAIGENIYGRPKQFLQKPWETIKDSFKMTPVDPKAPIKSRLMRYGGMGLFYGLPAYQAMQIMKDPPGNRAENMGGLIGGSALGLAAFSPFGMVGSIAAGEVGDRIGRKIGKKFSGPPEQTPYGDPGPYGQL
jgi:hypothetical protein